LISKYSVRSRLPARFVALTLGLVLGVACAAGAAQAQTAAKPEPARLAPQLEQLLAWMAGEWNNNEQVWQQKLDAEDPKVLVKEAPVTHQHQILSPMSAAGLGTHVLAQQNSRGDDLAQKPVVRVLRFKWDESQTGIRQETLLPNPDQAAASNPLVGLHQKPELQATLKPADFKHDKDCDLIWRFNAAEQAYAASAAAPPCEGKITRVTATQLLAHEGATALVQRHRKVRYYEGWLWFRNAGPGAPATDKNTSFTRKYSLHNEGGRVPVLQDDGTPTNYLLELAVLTYQNTRRPILKFTLLDKTTMKSVTYIWGGTDAGTLGMNLGWFQSGLTLKSERSNFGF
jgi:hypothetical protein